MYGFYIDASIHQIGYITQLIEKVNGILYTDSEISRNIITQDFPSIRLKYFPGIEAVRESMKSDRINVLILQDFHYKKFMRLKEEGIKFVQVFHGTSDKSYNTNRETIHYDLICLSGKKMLEDFTRKGLNKGNNCVITGNLKADRIFNGFHKRDREIKNLGLDPGKKGILYAPTWMDGMGNSSFKKFGVWLPDYFPPEYQLIIKLHPNLFTYQGPLVQKLKQHIRNRKNMILLENSREIYDIVPIMAGSDLLITDVSGVSHEYIAFLRPMVFLNNRSLVRFLYGNKRTRIWKAGDIVSSLNALPHAIRNNIENPGRYRKIQEALLQEIYTYSDGITADRIISAIETIL